MCVVFVCDVCAIGAFIVRKKDTGGAGYCTGKKTPRGAGTQTGRIMLCVALTAALAAVAPLRLHGLVTAVFSPFMADGVLDLTVVPKQQEFLNATGVQWTFVAGTTGESLSLTVSERKQLFDAWVRAGSNVIAHVGAESLADARELATYAQHAGAKAIGVMPPTFFKPANAEALATTITSVCAAAPALPCYYYHIPSMTGVVIDMLDFVRAIEPMSDTFAGIKYTGMYTYPGMMQAHRVLAYKGGKYEVLSGREEMMLEALSIGITGHVGSQFNFAGDLFNALIAKFDSEGLTKSSEAELRGLQLRALDLIAAWGAPATPPARNGGKYFMNLAGVPVGDARLPSLPLDDDGKAALKAAFDAFCQAGGPQPIPLSLRMCA